MRAKLGVESLEGRDCPSLVTAPDLGPALVQPLEISVSTLTTVQSGLFTDPATFGGVTPTAADHVVIAHDVTLDGGEAGRVDIQAGVTTLAGEFHAHGSVVVHMGATLTGTRGALFFHVPDDRLFVGATSSSDTTDRSDTDIGLWGMEGASVLLRGPEVTPYVAAVADASAPVISLPHGGTAQQAIGSGRATLSATPVGWEVGDTLLLTSLRGETATVTLTSLGTSADLTVPTLPDWLPGETRRIADGQGGWIEVVVSARGFTPPNTITFSGADAFAAESLLVEGRTLNPRIANLTRRLVVASADVREDDANHRAHTLFGHHSHVHLNYVEFRNLGPRGKLGRYPVHFHHAGHVEHEGGLVGSSIWQDVTDAGNRFLTIHASQHVKVVSNVGYRSQGHGFFLEDGSEVNNVFTGNLSADVREGEEIAGIKDGTAAAGTHHFWLRENNLADGNIAVGGTAPIGMVFLMHRVPGLDHDPVVATGNEFYGQAKYGVWTALTVYTQVPVPQRFVNTVAAFNGLAGMAALGGIDVTWDNPTAVYNGLGTGTYDSQIYVSSAKVLRINGGLLVGEWGYHLHYSPRVVAVGTVFRNVFLMNPTYFDMSIRFDACDIQADWLFPGTYPNNSLQPGLARFRNCVGVEDGDFVGPGDGTAFGLPGTPVKTKSGTTGAWKLDAFLPEAGLLVLPGTFQVNRDYWQLKPAGTATYGKQFVYTANQLGWQAMLAEGLAGYPFGIPPGTYDIIATKASDPSVTQAWEGVTVTAGQVTVLP